MSGLARVGKGRIIFTLLLFLQGFIVLTGAIVRITGSGLGCPTWPECAPGSFTPSPLQEESPLHAWIEFANRLLTFLLGFAALAAIIYALAFIPVRRIRALAALQLLGVIAQAILGGITVLTGLHPGTVVAHLLVSIPAYCWRSITSPTRLWRNTQCSPTNTFNATTSQGTCRCWVLGGHHGKYRHWNGSTFR